MSFIRQAMRLADGVASGVEALMGAIEQLNETAETLRRHEPSSQLELSVRLTTLDLRRPASDMLEDLVEGIRACWLLWQDPNFEFLDEDEDEDDTVQTEGRRQGFCDAVPEQVTLPS